MALLTVGVPVYNGEKHITRALDSLANQTNQDFLVLVSNNASTDKTPELISRHKGLRGLRVFDQETNIGPMRNFFFLLDRCKTPFFMWLAHDDYLSENYVEEMINTLKSEDAVLAVPKTCLFREGEPQLQELSAIHNQKIMHFPDTSAKTSEMYSRYPVAYWFYGVWKTNVIKSCWHLLDDLWPSLKEENYPAHGDVLMIYMASLHGFFAQNLKASHFYQLPPKNSGKQKVDHWARLQRSLLIAKTVFASTLKIKQLDASASFSRTLRMIVAYRLTAKLVKPRHLLLRTIRWPFDFLYRSLLNN